MTEEDVLWVPGIWEKEAEDKMIKRVGEGFEQCLGLSEGCTCKLLPSLSSHLSHNHVSLLLTKDIHCALCCEGYC
jgi:hypothetical protein